jgi:ATP-dependent DNA helicase DinG
MKGRSNYLCLKRWEAVADDPKRNLTPAERRQLLPLVVWAEETGDGDIDMHPSFASDLQGSLWRKLNADSPDCDRARCPRESVCFLQRIRKAARQADLVLVNHALLFSDLSSSGSIIGPYSALILDEAHQIEKVASNHLGLRLHPKLIADLVQSCMPVRGQRKSLHTLFQSRAVELRDDAFEKLEKLIHTIQQCADRLDHSSALFFNQLKTSIPLEKEPSVTRIRLSESPMQGEFQESSEAMDENLKSLHWSIAQCAQWIQDESFRILDDLLSECGRLMGEIERIRLIFDHFTEADYEEFIVWQEINTEREDRDVILQSVPLQIGKILAEKLYPRLLRCVFTSATLSVAGEFDYLIRQLGLDQVEPERLATRLFGSPFLYDEQVLMGIPAFLPAPNESDYIRDASDLIQKLLAAHPGGTLVLFTSNAMLQSTYARVKDSIADPDYTLMAQGIDGNRDQLLDRFRTDQRSILFGTSSFWEGIDVPGPALETLIITRIPFEVPTDPIVQARMEYIEKLTGNGFMNYTLPEAIIRLRQGFGRLIRSSQDRGMMLLMDMRLLKKSYGRRILESLPAQARVFQTENALFDAISTWFHTAH